MNVGCKHKVGDVIRGLRIIDEPYKIPGNKNYHAKFKCEFCGSDYTCVISEIKRHAFDGCGCQISRCNSRNWQSFEDWCIENESEYLLDLWDYDLNNTTPDKISSCTQKKYYFKCECGRHESELHDILVLTRIKHVKTICTKCKSIAQNLIDKYGDDALDIYWDWEKNDQDPWKLSFGTRQSVWIKCANNPRHDSRFRRIGDLISKDIGCPWCAQESIQSSYQIKTVEYINEKYNFDIYNEYDCSVCAVNPKTNRKLPYDNEVIINDSHLIIEVHGEQHYKPIFFIKLAASTYKVSEQEAFKGQQYRDKIKEDYIASLDNYYYIALPYWSFDDESYKTLIDNKIQEILTLTNENTTCA